MLNELWTWMRVLTPDFGAAPAPDGPPKLFPDLGSEPLPPGPPR